MGNVRFSAEDSAREQRSAGGPFRLGHQAELPQERRHVVVEVGARDLAVAHPKHLAVAQLQRANRRRDLYTRYEKPRPATAR